MIRSAQKKTRPRAPGPRMAVHDALPRVRRSAGWALAHDAPPAAWPPSVWVDAEFINDASAERYERVV